VLISNRFVDELSLLNSTMIDQRGISLYFQIHL